MDLSSGTDCSMLPVSRVIEEHYGIYPGVASFSRDVGVHDYRDWVEESNGDPLPAPLALYIQDDQTLPPDGKQRLPSAMHRSSAIEQELKMLGAIFDADRPVEQLICSGRIANAWSDDQLYRLVAVVQGAFLIKQSGLSNWCACTGGVFPSPARLRLLRILGFSGVRFSLLHGKQVQAAVDELADITQIARQLGYDKVVVDITPDETVEVAPIEPVERFLADTLPDRIRLLGEPDASELPYARILQSLGYRNIGMDWFLRPDDQWLKAKAAGQLHWSLLGFTDMSHPDVIGVGPGAISSVGSFYGINESHWDNYQADINAGELPVAAGIELESDDLLRREIMGMILAGSCIRISAIEEKWGINFRQFFAWESERLQALAGKQWLDWQAEQIGIRVQGSRELVELCRIFDRRRREESVMPRLSPVPN